LLSSLAIGGRVLLTRLGSIAGLQIDSKYLPMLVLLSDLYHRC